METGGAVPVSLQRDPALMAHTREKSPQRRIQSHFCLYFCLWHLFQTVYIFVDILVEFENRPIDTLGKLVNLVKLIELVKLVKIVKLLKHVNL